MQQIVESMSGKKRAPSLGGRPGKPRPVRRQEGVGRASCDVAETNAPAPTNFKELARFLDGVAIESEAAERGVSPRDIVEALPREAFSLASSRHFLAVMDSVSTWGPVSVPLTTASSIVEFNLVLPLGEIKNDYFYWLREGPIRGRLRVDQCDCIAFVERPFMGRPSAAVLFFNREGNIMFKIFLSRDENHQLNQTQLSLFRSLAKRIPRRASARSSRAKSKKG